MYVSFGLCTDQTTVLYQDSRLPLHSAAAEHSLAGQPDSYMSSFLSKCALIYYQLKQEAVNIAPWVSGYDKVSAIVQISLPLAAYFDIPQIAVKIDFFKQNHQLL